VRVELLDAANSLARPRARNGEASLLRGRCGHARAAAAHRRRLRHQARLRRILGAFLVASRVGPFAEVSEAVAAGGEALVAARHDGERFRHRDRLGRG